LYVLDREDGFPQSDVEDYLVLRTTASWRINPYVEVFGRVENLLNEQYEEVAGYPALDCGAYGGFKLSF
jgi:vitamin B12 transporter